MFYVRKPSDERVLSILGELRDTPFTYESVGITREELSRAPHGFRLDAYGCELGHGAAVFERAAAALAQIKNYPPSFTRVIRADAELVPGSTFAVLASHLGIASLHPCRVIYLIQEDRRFGFGFGTLLGHAESGEERFVVSLHDDASVHYHVQAFSRPHAWLARLGAPVSRAYQLKFQRETLEVMQRHARGTAG
jgi:uncharacterized protein (UPF0548 family)